MGKANLLSLVMTEIRYMFSFDLACDRAVSLALLSATALRAAPGKEGEQ
jgi:hypothetical protein